MKTKFLRAALLAAGCFAAVVTARAEPVLLGNADLAGQTLDAEAVKAVLLGKKVTLGSTRVVVVISKGGGAQEQFLQATVGMSLSQFQNHWRRLFMTGGGSAPKIVETEADACKAVAETPGAIAVADRGSAGSLVVLAAQ